MIIDKGVAKLYMEKIEINRKKEKRLFKILFLTPTSMIVTLLCIIIALPEIDFNLKIDNTIIALIVISIWFTIAFVLTHIISLIFYRERIQNTDNNIAVDEKKIHKKLDQNIYDGEKVFDYTFENYKFNKIYGETTYFVRNKKKYLEFGKKKIKNIINKVILIEIGLVTIMGVLLRLIYKPYIMIFLYLFSIIAVILAYKKVIPQYGSRKSYI